MSVYSTSLRTIVLATGISLSAMFAAPAQAFSDDEARRDILELREQNKQLTEQNRQARLQMADHIETLQHEMASWRGQDRKSGSQGKGVQVRVSHGRTTAIKKKIYNQ